MTRRLCTRHLHLLPLLFMSLLCYSTLTESTFPGAADDTFFYFRTAENIVQDGSVSFDGLSFTNGFHPLWMGLLTVLGFLVSGPFCYLSHARCRRTERDAFKWFSYRNGRQGSQLSDMGTEYILSWTGPHGVEDYAFWELIIPDKAQSEVFNNTILVYRDDEILRWPGNTESLFLWRLNDCR